MPAVEEVYLPDPRWFELPPFQDRVLELVQLFHDAPVVRIRVVGTIAAGEPIEAIEGPGEYVEIRGPAATIRRHRLLPLLRAYLCPSLQSVSADAFEIARVVTPLLVGLKLSGKVAIDLNPWLFAGVALLVERMGVAAFCAERGTGGDTEQHPPTSEKRRRRPKGTRRRPGK